MTERNYHRNGEGVLIYTSPFAPAEREANGRFKKGYSVPGRNVGRRKSWKPPRTYAEMDAILQGNPTKSAIRKLRRRVRDAALAGDKTALRLWVRFWVKPLVAIGETK